MKKVNWRKWRSALIWLFVYMSTQAITIRLIAIIMLIGLWNQLSETSWFALPPKMTNDREGSGRVLSGVDVSVFSGSKFISAQEAAPRVSPKEKGIFLYLNSEGEFYPEKVLQNMKEVHGIIEGFPFTIVFSTVHASPSVEFGSQYHVPYEYLTFEEARILLPEVLVFLPE